MTATTAAAASPRPRRSSISAYQSDVAGYTAAGGDETVQRVTSALTRISKRLDTYYRSQLLDLELQPPDWAVLKSLALEGPDGCSTPSRLADDTGVSPSTMTHRLDLLAARDLVRRTQDPDNRTRSKVELTRAGWRLFQRVIVEAEQVESKILDSLSGRDQKRLADLLEQLLFGLDASTSHATRTSGQDASG